MGTTTLDLDSILRIPPMSPSRRDYGIRTPPRSPSPVHCDSRPESPWLAAEQALSPTSREVETFRRYESNPPPLVLDRGAYYSGPLPAARERSSLPSFSGPLPGSIPSVNESFEFATWARNYHQHVNDGTSLPGSGGSSRDSSFRKETEESELAKEDSTSTFYLAAPQFSARAGMHGRVGSVSGELGRTDEVEKQKSLIARGYKSGEIDIAAAYGFDIVRQQRWESLNKDTSPSRDEEPMVTIPFRWDEASPRSRASSKSGGAQIGNGIGDFSFGSSQAKSGSEKTESVHGSETSVSVSSKPELKAAVAAPAKAAPTKKATGAVVRSSVPFKWEDAPGKPKLEENVKSKASTEKTTALQLPPRLASASVKRTSWSTSTPSSTFRSRSSRGNVSHTPAKTRPVKTHSQSSPDSSKSKYSHKAPVSKAARQQPPPQPAAQPSPQPSLQPSSSPQPSPQPRSSPRPSSSPQPPSSPQPSPSPQPLSLDAAQPRHTLGPNFLSGPLDATAKPPTSTASKSGPISQLGFPQYDFFSIRSPTSTLQGPSSISSDGLSHTSENCSRKSPSVTYSHSGTSAESLEHWSDQDHAFESQSHATTQASDSFEPTQAPETTMHKLRRRLPKSSSSKSKPPMSPISPSPSSIASDFDKTPAAEDSSRDEPPTRLPYKMPETNQCQEIVVLKPAGRVRSNSKCFELPRFRSKSSGQEMDPAWAAPSGASEDGYRSSTYTATLELLSPSPSTKPTTVKSRSASASPRHFVEGLCNSLKHSLHRISKRNGGKTNATLQDDPFLKRHQSLGL